MGFLLLLYLVSVSIDCTLCCDCELFRWFHWDYSTVTSISLEGSIYIYIEAYSIDRYDCSEVEAYWEILRADGDTVVYTVLNNNYNNIIYEQSEYLPDKGLWFDSFCYCIFDCSFYLEIRPIDLRYNGAQITGVINMPECFNSPNVTDTITLNIQGLLEAPLDVVVDVVSSESVNVSWSPPFTLDEIPILYYTVNVTSQGTLNEQINTNETLITLERPCTSTTYQISAWNEVGEGSAAEYDLILIQVIVKATSDPGGVCVSCSFPSDSTAEECAIQLQNDEHTFSFNLSRQAHEELILLECFTVPEAGVFSVLLYEVELDGAIEYHITCGLSDVIIKPAKSIDNNSTQQGAEVTGLSAALGVLVACVIAAVIMGLIVFRRRNIHMDLRRKNTSSATETPNIARSEQPTRTTPLYVNTAILPPPASAAPENNMHEQIEFTDHEKEIELSLNAAYGRILR